MAHNVDSMMYVGEKPWHGLGVYVGDREVTAAQAIVAAGLDWKAEKMRAFQQLKNGQYVWNGGYNIVRSDNERVLGRVGEKYQPLQNVEAFEFMDQIIGKGRAFYHTAGALQFGERIWILVRVGNGEGSAEISKGDVVENYVLLCNGHNGGTALDIIQTNVRVVCQNTLNMALTNKEKGHFFKFKHTRNVADKSVEVREALMAVDEKFKKFIEAGRLLHGESINRSELEEFLIRLELDRANEREESISKGAIDTFKKTERFDQLIASATRAPGNEMTLWGAVNAVTHYVDHVAIPKNAGSKRWDGENDARLNYAWFGTGAEKKERALSLALEFASKR